MATYKPVIEPESPTAFLTTHPLTSIPEQSVATPLLFGVNYDDGAMKSARKRIYLILLELIETRV